MGGSNQSKSAYNQARAQQNWEQQQYNNLANAGGPISKLQPVADAGNQLLSMGGVPSGVASGVQSNENAADTAIRQGENAAQRQGASTVASTYGNLAQTLANQNVRQGGYSPGFGVANEDLARNTAESESQASIAPQEQMATQLQTQANQNAANSLALGSLGLQGTQLGANLAQIPYQAQLQALGLTEGDVNNLIATQGNIGHNIASPLQNVSSIVGDIGTLSA